MDESFEYIIESARMLQAGTYSDGDLEFIFHLVLAIDNDTINEYNLNTHVLGYECDLELYNNIVEFLIERFEESEDYEKCQRLFERFSVTKEIIKNKVERE